MSLFVKTALPSFLLLLLCGVASGAVDDGRVHSVPSANDVDHRTVAEPAPDSRLHILLFETDRERVPDILLTKQIVKAGISYSVFGTGAKFEGFGTKWGLALSALDDVPPDDLVAISDGRDVILNIHGNDKDQGRRTIEGFELAYRALTLNKPGAVVMSAEGQCCVSALTHAKPGSYFHANGTRAERACASGEEGCMWAGDSHKLPWQNMMQELAKNSMQGHYVQDSYLNAGLVAGRAQDVKRLIKLADMKAFEDDQAVFTDLLYTWPDLLVLDYAQEMFGNMRWTLGMAGGGCNVAPDKSKPTAGLVHTETQTVPLFLHTPGKFLECLDHLADSLEITAFLSDSKQSQRLLRGQNQNQIRRAQTNYGSSSPTASPTSPTSPSPTGSPSRALTPSPTSEPTSVTSQPTGSPEPTTPPSSLVDPDVITASPTSSPTDLLASPTASPTTSASSPPTPSLQVGATMEFDVTTAFFGPALPYHVTITDMMSQSVGQGGRSLAFIEGVTITIREEIVGNGNMTGDIRGVFFHVDGDPSSIQDENFVKATGPVQGQNYLGKHACAKNKVLRVGRTDVQIKERKKQGRTYDVGIEIGTKGIAKDDIKVTTITIKGITVRNFTGEFAILSRRIGDKKRKRKKRGFRKYNAAMIAVVPNVP